MCPWGCVLGVVSLGMCSCLLCPWGCVLGDVSLVVVSLGLCPWGCVLGVVSLGLCPWGCVLGGCVLGVVSLWMWMICIIYDICLVVNNGVNKTEMAYVCKSITSQ